MKWDYFKKPDATICRITFENVGESLVVEGDAMAAQDTALKMETTARGGLLASAKRMLMRENIFQNTYTATAPNQQLWLAPPWDGDIECYMIAPGRGLRISSSCFVASAPSVTLDTRFEGLGGFFNSTGLFMANATGEGPVFFNGYGALHRIDLEHGQTYVVDNTHIAAFTEGLTYQTRPIKGLLSVFIGGEALVCQFSGQGSIWIQTRSPEALVKIADPFRRIQRSNSDSAVDALTDMTPLGKLPGAEHLGKINDITKMFK